MTAEGAGPAAGHRPRQVLGAARDYGVYVAIVLLILINSVITPHFLSLDNLRCAAVPAVPVLIVALAWPGLGHEGIDLSVGAVSRSPPRSFRSISVTGRGRRSRWPWSVGAVSGLVGGSMVAYRPGAAHRRHARSDDRLRGFAVILNGPPRSR